VVTKQQLGAPVVWESVSQARRACAFRTKGKAAKWHQWATMSRQVLMKDKTVVLCPPRLPKS
jgi:hypothetical protein